MLDTVVSTPSSSSKMDNTAFMHSFYVVYKADDEIHVLKLYVEQALNNKGTAEFTRAYQLKDIKKVAVLGDGVSKGKPLLSGANTATINSISELVDVVKQNDPEYKPKPLSKVVTLDGTPKVMYHGSPAQFTIFDKKKARSSGAYGSGFYFTDSQSHASTYGQQYSVYLNIRNPLQYGGGTVSREQVRQFLEAVAENEDYSIENYGTYDVDSIVQNIIGRESKTDAFKVIQEPPKKNIKKCLHFAFWCAILTQSENKVSPLRGREPYRRSIPPHERLILRRTKIWIWLRLCPAST